MPSINDSVTNAPSAAGAPLIHVGRQPIFDRSGDVIAYELLFRDSATAVTATRRSALATGSVIVSAFTEFGLEQITGAKLCFINVTREFLIGELPVPFDPGQAVLEVVEDVDVDDRVTDGVRALKDRGFTIALDDFTWDSGARRLIGLADYVKIDTLSTESGALRQTVHACRDHQHLRLVAERLETEEQLRTAVRLGFDYFQGHVLGQPHVVSRVALSPARISRLQLVTALGAADIDFDQVVTLIMRDPSLSYRLLHATNSAASGLSARVSTVREAAVLLGLETVRQWVVLMLFSDLTDATEDQLTATMTRARFCQLIAEGQGQPGEAAFTVGLLASIADLIAQPTSAVVAQLPLAAEVEAALTTGSGELGRVLAAVRSYERGQVVEAAEFISLHPVRDADLLMKAYLSAMGWSTRLVDALPAEEATRRVMPAG